MSISEVTDHLHLAPAKAVKTEAIKALNITCVINFCPLVIDIQDEGIEYISIPVEDSVKQNISDIFDEIADKIFEVYQQGGKTLVCCVAGISRSASFCLVYLMKHQDMKLRNAFYCLKSRRRMVRPNNGFFKQLINYEQKLFGEVTVKMVTVPCADSKECIVPDVFYEVCKGMVWLKSCKNSLKKK